MPAGLLIGVAGDLHSPLSVKGLGPTFGSTRGLAYVPNTSGIN